MRYFLLFGLFQRKNSFGGDEEEKIPSRYQTNRAYIYLELLIHTDKATMTWRALLIHINVHIL